ncbi:MAG: cytochrome C oxidase subunit IV family protein [Spirosomataceae bacterium]
MASQINNSGEKLKPQTKELWKVFVILLVLTALEFAIAFGLDTDQFKWTKIIIFILMTIVKAFYIVGTFMHLKQEVKVFVWSVVLPALFVVWLLVALIAEGGYIGKI